MVKLNKEVFSNWTPMYTMATCSVQHGLCALYFRPDFNTDKIVYIVRKPINKKEVREYMFENLQEALDCYNEEWCKKST